VGGATPTSAVFTDVRLSPAGIPVVIGSNTDGRDWVWVDGTVRASIGAPVVLCPSCVGCPGYTWATPAAAVANSFVLASANSRGDVIIAGRTDAGVPLADQALVLNGSEVLARSNDPVDLDGNGIFDDDAFIRSFDSRGFISEGYALVVVGLRDARAALCGEADVEIGQAVLRFAVACPGDVDDGTGGGRPDGGVAVEDLLYFPYAFLCLPDEHRRLVYLDVLSWHDEVPSDVVNRIN
jgi:hypothetical protein